MIVNFRVSATRRTDINSAGKGPEFRKIRSSSGYGMWDALVPKREKAVNRKCMVKGIGHMLSGFALVKIDLITLAMVSCTDQTK